MNCFKVTGQKMFNNGDRLCDRRKGPDILVKWVKWSESYPDLVSAILFITLIAKPGFESWTSPFA